MDQAVDSEMFQIIFWSSVSLIVLLIASVLTLAYMDPTTDTLLYANDALNKKN